MDRLTYFNTLLFPMILGVRLCMRPFLSASTTPGSKSDLGMPRFGLNAMLHRVFAAEGGWLRRRDLPVGVSLLAVATPGG